MPYPRNTTIPVSVFYADFTGVGKTGLTITADLQALTLAGTYSSLLTNQAVTEDGNGFYHYTIPANQNTAELDLLVRFVTTATTVPQQQQAVTVPVRAYVEYLDAAISSRLATAGYTAPDNATISTLKTLIDTITAEKASSAEVQAGISNIIAEIDALPVPEDYSENLATILDDLSDVLTAISAVETEADAATRYANLLANILAAATPADVTDAQQAIIAALPDISELALEATVDGVQEAVDALAIEVLALDARIGAAEVTVVSTLSSGSKLYLTPGMAYNFAGTLSGPTWIDGGQWPDLAGRALTWRVSGIEPIICELLILDPGTPQERQAVQWPEVDGVTTALIPAHEYELWADYDDEEKATRLATGPILHI